MRTLKLASLLASIFTLLGMLIFLIPPMRGPRFEGKALGRWLDAAVMDGGKDKIDKAAEAVIASGTNAIPLFINMLRVKESQLPILDSLGNMIKRGIGLTTLPVATRYHEAIFGFKVLGATASNSVPDLTRIYEENASLSSRMAVLEALGCIGPMAAGASNAVISAMTNTNPELRNSALRAFGRVYKKNHQRVLDVMIEAAQDSDFHVRMTAAAALGETRSDAQSAVMVLVELSKDPEWQVRGDAVRALGKIALGSTNVINALLPRLHDEDISVRLLAAEALLTVDRDNPQAIAVLEAVAKSDDDRSEWAKTVLKNRLNFCQNREE